MESIKLLEEINIRDESKEELLPGMALDFPYLATRADLNRYMALGAPWHWHKAVELFYVESGCVEYTTPHGKRTFPAGSGGFVNANVLHMTCVTDGNLPNVQLLHLFDPVFLAGGHGSRIEEKYILPLTSAPDLEILSFSAEDPGQKEILEDILRAFQLSPEEWGYEWRLREALMSIWQKILKQAGPLLGEGPRSEGEDRLVKALMVYIHEHYQNPISIDQLAAYGHISKRSCFRLFQTNLRMTPVEYIREYRLKKACELLADTDTPITQIAYGCGFGSGSYFGKIFRLRFRCTPWEYRRDWHERYKNQRK